jgi:hypothetical protein
MKIDEEEPPASGSTDGDVSFFHEQLQNDGRLQLPLKLRKIADLQFGETLEITYADGLITIQPLRAEVAAIRAELLELIAAGGDEREN